MLPDEMDAVRFKGAGEPLLVERIPVPRPARGEVLIRMAAAPVNPSDLGFLTGASASSPSPIVPGHEGSGTVTAAGPGVIPRLLVGRRVAFASAQGGTWAEYAVAAAMRCIPLRKNLSLEQGATLIVNPLTAIAFFELAKRGGHTALVNNAAASALGRMIVRLGRTSGVTVINIVRRQDQVDLLKALGAEHVLDSTDNRFASRLRELAHRLRATLVFDAVGGTQTQTLVDAVPFGSTIVVYSALAGEPSVFNPRTVAGDDKKLVGFYLGNWLKRRGIVGTLRDIRRVQRLASSELQTTVHGRFPLSAAQAAVDAYRGNMTAGKVLLVADAGQVPFPGSSETAISRGS